MHRRCGITRGKYLMGYSGCGNMDGGGGYL